MKGNHPQTFWKFACGIAAIISSVWVPTHTQCLGIYISTSKFPTTSFRFISFVSSTSNTNLLQFQQSKQSTMNTTYSYPTTGIYSLDNTAASLIHCSVETSLCDDYEVSIQLGMLYQNTTSEAIEDATFFCKLDSVDSAMTSFSCSVERSHYIDQESRFERRMVKRAIKEGASFQCSVGDIPAGSDAVVFIRYVSRSSSIHSKQCLT